MVRHVRDVAALHVFLLGGPFPGFRLTREFDPVVTPPQWLEASYGESPEDTVRELARLVKEEERLLRAKAETNPNETTPGALGRTLDWPVQSTHTFGTRGCTSGTSCCPAARPRSIRPMRRLATMYGLLCAAAPPSWNGDYVHAGMVLEGAVDSSYVVASVNGVIRVLAAPVDATGRLTGTVARGWTASRAAARNWRTSCTAPPPHSNSSPSCARS